MADYITKCECICLYVVHYFTAPNQVS